MRKGSPQPIGEVLPEVVERLSHARKGEAARISAAWKAIAGRGLTRHTRPAGLRRGTLLILVDSSAWFYQAALEKERLLAGMQKEIGESKVQRIQFRIGQI